MQNKGAIINVILREAILQGVQFYVQPLIQNTCL